MSDVRALLKAKRQETHISHPYAAYSQSGQLKCSVCGSLVKHASAWDGHLGSKAHRTNVARLKQELEKSAAKARNDEEGGQHSETQGKRKASEHDVESDAEAKRRKVDGAPSSSNGFPADFFSDPTRAPASLAAGSDDEDDEAPPPTQPTLAIDLEYERFQRELLQLDEDRHRETYDRATIFVEAVPASTEIAGFPAEPASEEAPVVNQVEARLQKEQDEKELIMDRVLDEERAQEEADMRVERMKKKIEDFKKKREGLKAQSKVNG